MIPHIEQKKGELCFNTFKESYNWDDWYKMDAFTVIVAKLLTKHKFPYDAR